MSADPFAAKNTVMEAGQKTGDPWAQLEMEELKLFASEVSKPLAGKWPGLWIFKKILFDCGGFALALLYQSDGLLFGGSVLVESLVERETNNRGPMCPVGPC